MKSEGRAWNKSVLALGFLIAVLSGLAVLVAYFWTTRSDVVAPPGSGEASPQHSTAVPASSERGDTRRPAATLRPRPALRLIITAVADDPTESTATVHVDAHQKTFVAHPGDVVTSDTDPEDVSTTDGGVALTVADTMLESVGPGWARFQRGDEQWILEITDEAPLAKLDVDTLVAILGDPSLSPGEKAGQLLEAKRGLPVRENFMSEASFAPRFDEHGEMNGLHIRSVVPDGVYARMGLAGGDVLLAVDGVALDSPEASDTALAAFESSSSLRITRERDGEAEGILVQRATDPKDKE